MAVPSTQAARNEIHMRLLTAAATGDLATLEALRGSEKAWWKCLLRMKAASAIPELGVAASESVMITAARCNQCAVVEWLLKQRKPLAELVNSTGQSPLHYASDPMITSLLLQNKWNPFLWDYSPDEFSPLDSAIISGNLACTVILEEYFARRRSRIHIPPAVQQNYDEKQAIESSQRGKSAEADAKTRDIVASYANWGGWAAVVASCGDVAALRQEDQELDRLLGNLDRLDDCKHHVFTTLVACDFSFEDRNRLASPLLDGLWYAATLERPSNKAQPCKMDYRQQRLDDQTMIMRLVRSNIEFVDALTFLLERGVTTRDFAYSIAARRGHCNVLRALLKFGPPFTDVEARGAAMGAAKKGCMAMLQLLYNESAETLNLALIGEAVVVAALLGGDYPEVIDFVYTHGYSRLDAGYQLQVAVKRERVKSRQALVAALNRAADRLFVASRAQLD